MPPDPPRVEGPWGLRQIYLPVTLKYPLMQTRIETPAQAMGHYFLCTLHCSTGQSCCSMTSKHGIDWFLELLGHEVFSPECSLNQPKATCACVSSINHSNHSLSVHLLFLFCSHVFISMSCENRSISLVNFPISLPKI